MRSVTGNHALILMDGQAISTEQAIEALNVNERLLEDRQRVIDAIPECHAHGNNCVPHALEWLRSAKAFMGLRERQAPVKKLDNWQIKDTDNEVFLISADNWECGGNGLEFFVGEEKVAHFVRWASYKKVESQ